VPLAGLSQSYHYHDDRHEAVDVIDRGNAARVSETGEVKPVAGM
jgi:hypothetical protein